jgi:putative ABC transport system ATP-binding protein
MAHRHRLVRVAEVSTSGSSAIEARQLFRFYHAGNDETLALRGVSVSVQRGEMVAVTGPSGSGKSTLLACLAGLDEPDGGVVRIVGETMSRRPEPDRAALRARYLGMLFQYGNLIEHLTVTENVLLAQRLYGRADRRRVHSLLDELGLSTRRTARPSELSGGEGARAGLAVAMANAPAVLLADEPTGELDGIAQIQVLDLLRARANDGTAVMVVTHNHSVAAAADRRIRLVDGEVQS